MPEHYSLHQAVHGLGLSDKETAVYMTLLELGTATASQIARKARINRSTTYVILDTLANKNLILITGKEPKQEYSAEPPRKILSFLQQQLKKTQHRLERAEEILPELESLYNVRGRPKVKFYEGEDGLTEVYETTLTSKEAIRGFGGVEDMRKALPKYFESYMGRRAGKDIKINAIFADTPKARELVAYDKEQNRTSALVPADKYYSSPEFNFFDDKTMIVSYRERLAIIIESQEIADGLKKLFDLAWQTAKKTRQKTINKNLPR